MQKVLAYRYSHEREGKELQKEEVELLDQKSVDGVTKYIVKTQDGISCTAIYNIFSNAYYADDIYGILDKEDLQKQRKTEAEM